MMMWLGHGMGFGWGIFGGLLMFVFLGGLIVLGFFAIRALSNTRPSQQTGDTNQTPLEILKVRYAHGEISKAEYEEMRQELS